MNGPFGNGFPYVNFHEMNMDWIIKIAKDFMDQYTTIQQTITQGLDDLDTKAQQLQAALDAWYDEHSQDITDQLADALQDLNNWYTQHQGYLDQYLQDSIIAFGVAANAKAAEAIATIPEDYTDLSNAVLDLQAHNVYNIILNRTGNTSSGTGITFTRNGEIITANGTATTGCNYNFVNSNNNLLGMIPNERYKVLFNTSDSNITLNAFYYKADGSFSTLDIKTDGTFVLPNNAVGIWFRGRIESGTTVNNATFSLAVYSLQDVKMLDTVNNVITNGLYDLVRYWHDKYGNRITGSGITYTWNPDYSLTVNGTADANQNSYLYFLHSLTNTDIITPGKKYSAEFSSSDSNITLDLIEYHGNPFRAIAIDATGNIPIDTDATGFMFRIAIPAGTTVTNATVKFKMYSTITPDNIDKNLPTWLPVYWENYLNNKAHALFEADCDLGYHGFSFAFFTDLHWLYNTKHSPNILRWIKNHTNITTFIQGGDVLSNYTMHGLNPDLAYREYLNKTKDLNLINIFGNHDLDTSSQTSDIYSKTDYYGICQRYTENIVTWHPGTLCGFMDNPVQKVRLIFWDYSNVYYDPLKAWINELPSGWSVLVFTHVIWQTAADTNPNPTYGQPLINAIDSVYDTAACTIIGIVCGHLHADKDGVSTKGYPIIGTTCDASSGGQPDLDPEHPVRTPGTTTEQAIDLFYVDTENRTINTIRIGVGDVYSNRSFTYPAN